jgi:putative membrane protein
MPDAIDEPRRQPAASSTAVREHMANERTHLAFLRTAIGLITLGMSINRFSLFLIMNGNVRPGSGQLKPLFEGEQLGVAMVVVGAALIVWAAYRYTQVSYQIDRGEYLPNRSMVWVLTAAVLIFGVVGIFWLFQR